MFELFGPVIELIGYTAFIVALMLGHASPAYTVAFLALAVFLGSAISISAVALEEVSFRRYRRFQDLLVLLGVALVENFGYRQMSTWWRLHGLVSATRRDLPAMPAPSPGHRPPTDGSGSRAGRPPPSGTTPTA